jgi:hypothetical protein
MGAAGAVLVAECLDIVAQLAQRGRSGATGQAGSDNDDVVFALVGGIHQFQVEAVLVPGLFNRSGWTFSVKYHNNPLISEFLQ